MGGSKSATQKKEDEAKLKMVQMVEKRKKEAAKKAKAEHIGKELGK